MRFRSALVAVSFLLSYGYTLSAVDILYVTTNNNTIIKYDTSGNYLGLFADSNLNNPHGLVFDSAGNLYASNRNGNSISKFDSSGLFKGSISTSQPFGLAFDSSGNLYAANDGESSISKFDSTGSFVSYFGPATTGYTHVGLSFDSSGYLYAANNNNTIDKYDPLGNLVSTLINDSRQWTPVDIAFDSAGILYTSNYGSSTISKFDTSGGFISTIGTPDEQPILCNPNGLVFDSLGCLYVANVYRQNENHGFISKFDPSGNFVTSWDTAGIMPRALALHISTVPEPSGYALAAIATGVIAYLVRHRK
jgi:tripartite motif-containing protein 71